MSVTRSRVRSTPGLWTIAAAALVGSATCVVLEDAAGLGGVPALVTLTAVIASVAALGEAARLVIARHTDRLGVAVIGDRAVAERLRRDLAWRAHRFTYTGRIALSGADAHAALAPLSRLRQALVDHHIELLVLSPSAPREAVFGELVSHCLDLRVQVVELAAFYESVFGYVPLSEMNAFWFQYLVDPSWRFPHPIAKRAIDLIAATLLAVPSLPLCALLIFLIRRDGGPGTFRQQRIGEGGRPFTLYKLRTMRPTSDTRAQWAALGDARVTAIGRLLRCTHLDELPQLLNVLRGEMSLVGPRPEQPAIVEQLEREVPFYQRRHLIRPGITGWAQIRCGYARSDSGSVWKHCHDLYYLKHRSIRLDLWILAETVRLVVRGAIRRSEAVVRSDAPIDALVTTVAAQRDDAGQIAQPNRASTATTVAPRAAERAQSGRR